MVSTRASKPLIKALAGISILFGIATIASGGRALFVQHAIADPTAKIVPFVLYFNFAAGFAYIITGLGLMLRRRWAPAFAVAIAVTTTIASIGLGVWIFAGNPYEMRTVGAMSLRTAFWIGVSLVSILRWRAVSTTRLLISLVAIIGMSGCASRPGRDSLIVQDNAPGIGQKVTIIAATDRQRDSTGIGYTAARAPTLQFERFTVRSQGARDDSKSGAINTPASSAQKYLVTSREIVDANALNTHNDILIYVHGYNYTFQEALFRLASVVEDGNLTETPVLFAWPSEGVVTGYVADKDAAAYARDDLAKLLANLAKRHPKRHITLFGHSMGAWLAVEALRQLKLADRDDVLRHVNQVVLAAPDIDIDLFKRQIDTIGPLPHPIILLNSTDDRALAISSRIGGSRMRIGSVGEKNTVVRRMVADGAIKVIELSKFPTPDGTNHNRFIKLVDVLAKSENKENTLLNNGFSSAIWHIGSLK